jgi:hypothetical protein
VRPLAKAPYPFAQFGPSFSVLFGPLVYAAARISLGDASPHGSCDAVRDIELARRQAAPLPGIRMALGLGRSTSSDNVSQTRSKDALTAKAVGITLDMLAPLGLADPRAALRSGDG